ncbi:MAG: V-type ATP synthase subunit E [Clostridia bacterium]|nr:V-type ATP synthase subunit E [Clostridia bacterium]
MADLRIITDRIAADAQEKAKEILKQADAKYTEILAEYKARAQADGEKTCEQARKDSEILTTSAISGAAKEKAQAILAEKNRLITETLLKAEETVYNMQDAEYMALMEKLLAKHKNDAQKGEIVFNAKDKARLSDGMKTAMEKAGLTLSADTADIRGGFILKYGMIEENCAVEALFREHHEMLVDIVCHELF